MGSVTSSTPAFARRVCHGPRRGESAMTDPDPKPPGDGETDMQRQIRLFAAFVERTRPAGAATAIRRLPCPSRSDRAAGARSSRAAPLRPWCSRRTDRLPVEPVRRPQQHPGQEQQRKADPQRDIVQAQDEVQHQHRGPDARQADQAGPSLAARTLQRRYLPASMKGIGWPPPTTDGSTPFHLLIACSLATSGFWRSASPRMRMDSASPRAWAIC